MTPDEKKKENIVTENIAEPEKVNEDSLKKVSGGIVSYRGALAYSDDEKNTGNGSVFGDD